MIVPYGTVTGAVLGSGTVCLSFFSQQQLKDTHYSASVIKNSKKSEHASRGYLISGHYLLPCLFDFFDSMLTEMIKGKN